MIRGISPALRDDLLAYLLCTSPDPARLIADLIARNPGIADLLMDLEAETICEPSWRSNYSAEQAAAKPNDRPRLVGPFELEDAG